MDFTRDFLNFWKGLADFVQKQGYWRMIKLVVFVSFAVCIFYISKNFGESFRADTLFNKEIVNEAIEDNNQFTLMEHTEKIKVRESIKPKISAILKETLHNLNADRAFVLELHNGSNNTSGLPFIHCSMTYEEVSKGIEPVDEDYQNLSLSRFSFPEYLHENDFWLGTVDEFAEVDAKVSSRMKGNGTSYLVITTIRTGDNELGYYGFTYCNGKQPKGKDEILPHIITKVQLLSKLLDNTTPQDEI
jgi:hypothetical protein